MTRMETLGTSEVLRMQLDEPLPLLQALVGELAIEIPIRAPSGSTQSDELVGRML
jgi:hypothetical protein